MVSSGVPILGHDAGIQPTRVETSAEKAISCVTSIVLPWRFWPRSPLGSNVPIEIHKKVPNGEGLDGMGFFLRMRYQIVSIAI